MGKYLNVTVPLIVSVGLYGCANYSNRFISANYSSLNSVPYDLGGSPEVFVKNEHLFSQNDLMFFNNARPSAFPSTPNGVNLADLADLNLLSFHIRNIGNVTIRFMIRAIPGDWVEYNVQSGDFITPRCQNCTSDTVQIAIPTEGLPILVREINLQERYDIYWSEPFKRWDIRSIRRL
jgi:hypothetical protein